MREMLLDWNAALDELRPLIQQPDVPQPTDHYGEALVPADLRPIPDIDLPPGLPAWMRSLDSWATRKGDTPEDKRATIVVRVPTRQRPW